MKVKLLETDNDLNEVVVTGYQVQRKADLTGAVSVVKTEGITTSPDADPMKALQGKVAGMTITDTGSPSGTATVNPWYRFFQLFSGSSLYCGRRANDRRHQYT